MPRQESHNVHSLPPYYHQHRFNTLDRISPAPTLVAHSSSTPHRSISPHHQGGPTTTSVPPPNFTTSRHSGFTHPSPSKELYPYVKGKKVSPEQLADLLALFAQDDNPSKEQRIYHANRLKMSFKALSIWFQNERANVKKGRVRVCTPISGSSSARPSLLHIRTTTTPIRDQVHGSSSSTSSSPDGSSPVSPYHRSSHVLLRGTPSSSYPSFGRSHRHPHGHLNPEEDVNMVDDYLPSHPHHQEQQHNKEGDEDHWDGESNYSSSSEYGHDSDETTQVPTPVMHISKELLPIINVSSAGSSSGDDRRLDDEGLLVAEILAGMKQRSVSP